MGIATRIAALCMAVAIQGCQQGLPHRPVNELTNWGQGRAPTPSMCPPGTVQLDVEGMYLECLRGTN